MFMSMQVKVRLCFGCILTLLFCLSMMLCEAEAIVINLEDIDSGLPSPTGNYRWLDVANQPYSEDYRNSYDYTQATVTVSFDEVGTTLHAILTATNLKPNFAYQLKLAGFSGSADNERIGLTGRWWQEEWNGTQWANGQNLNNKGDGSSPNPNDTTYFARRDIADLTSPTGLRYRYTGYLVFDYFITDEYGNVILNFETNSSYHVLWKTSQRTRAGTDGPVKAVTFDADLSSAYDDTGGDDYPSKDVSIFGEWERLPVGGVYLLTGYYHAQAILTEESFHGSGGSFAGSWAGAMGSEIQFNIGNLDNCPSVPNPDQQDSDFDGFGDACDNCPITPNGPGNGTCTPDSDNPGTNCTDRAPCINSCTSNGDCSMDQEDVDGDGVGDVCDNCPNKCNVDQWDADTDEDGDVCDPDPGCGGCDQPECEVECGTS